MARIIRDVKKLQLRAVRGDRASQEALLAYNDRVAKEVNRKLRELERAGYDFGAYNTATHFTETMYDTKRFKTGSQMEGDWYLMGTQTAIGVKFLNMKSSTVEGQKEIEQRRFDTFVELDIIPADYSRRKFKNFVMFVGNEESERILDEYGTSTQMVEMLFDAYNRKGNTKKKMLKVFREYLDAKGRGQKPDFFKAMAKIGVDPDDYRAKRYEDR